MPSVICIATFNPPVIKFLGASIKDSTLEKVQKALYDMTNGVVNRRKVPPKFEQRPNPEHWQLSLDGHYCDHLTRSMMFLTIVEALEAEDWKLKGSNCVALKDKGCDSTKFFFMREE
eukprot:EG_transcript_35106